MHPYHRLSCISICYAALAACGSSSYSSESGTAEIASTGSGTSGTTPPSTTFNQGAINTGTHDSVVGVVTSATVDGKVSVIVGVKGTAAITFNSDDGKPITGFSITHTTLPADWTMPAVVGCAQVSTGSSCVLNFSYAPKAYLAGGNVILHYLYVDDAAEPVTIDHTMTFGYQATTQNNVVATVQPVGQITATALAVQTVTVTFDTDDTYPAYAVTPDLSALPAGWTVASPPSAGCATVSTGNGCELSLQYAPTYIDNGTLTLNYTYQDDSLETKSAKVAIPYAATIDNNVAATVNPTSVATIVGNPNGHATLYFATDRGPVTNVMITSDVAALPQYWTADAQGFACAELDPTTAAACTFGLTFAPMAPSSGVVSLNYSYINDAGFTKTGTAMIPYQSTTDNNVNGVANPALIAATVGTATPVSFTFNTDDGYPATGFSITSGLSPLPVDWSNSAGPSFSCANFGTSCVLTLTYAPTSSTVPTPLTLGYSYTNDAGTVKTGTVTVTYSATP